MQERYEDICQLKENLKKLSKKRLLTNYRPRAFSGRRRTGGYLKYSHRSVSQRKGKGNSEFYRRSRRRISLMMLHRTQPSSSDGGPLLWLHTHRWHVKRFRMCQKWGYALPKHHSARGLRFVWNKMKTGSIVHDESYLKLVELQGAKDGVIELLSNLMVSSGGFKFICADDYCTIRTPCRETGWMMMPCGKGKKKCRCHDDIYILYVSLDITVSGLSVPRWMFPLTLHGACQDLCPAIIGNSP